MSSCTNDAIWSHSPCNSDQGMEPVWKPRHSLPCNNIYKDTLHKYLRMNLLLHKNTSHGVTIGAKTINIYCMPAFSGYVKQSIQSEDPSIFEVFKIKALFFSFIESNVFAFTSYRYCWRGSDSMNVAVMTEINLCNTCGCLCQSDVGK